MDDIIWEKETNKRLRRSDPKFSAIVLFVEMAKHVDDLVLKLPARSVLRTPCKEWGEESMRRLKIITPLISKITFHEIQRFIVQQVTPKLPAQEENDFLNLDINLRHHKRDG